MSQDAAARPLILMVDDLPANLHMLAAALRDDYRVKVATSGEAALRLVAGPDLPELILLDVMMPGMSGIDVMRQLRLHQDTRDIPVIFVSADASEQTQLEGLHLGADDYLVKPVAPPVLLARVRILLERKRSERKLRLAARVFESSGEAIIVTDKDNCIIEVNPAFTQLTKYTLEEVKGKNPRILSAGRTSPEVYQGMWRDIRESGFWQGELWDRDKDGRIYPKFLTISVVRNAFNDIDFHIGSFIDMSERKEAEERIERLAHEDALTGLLNRYSLQNRLAQALAAARRGQNTLAVMFIDMDRFKTINDTLGHATGDALLVQIAQRVRQSVRESDIAARLGGDEFVVILTGIDDPAVIGGIAEKVRDNLSWPYQVDSHELHTSPSIGIACFPADGEDGDALMRNADSAMYQAKEQGRNNIQFYTAALSRAAAERLRLERDLRRAIEARQFELHYQPQVRGRDGRVMGFEALLRWRHPIEGLVSPARFIPVAEDSGLILPIGEWVLDEACRQLAEWRRLGHAEPVMAVNLSARQLRSATLLADVTMTLGKHGLAGGDLELEITESVAMKDPEASIGILKSLRIFGVHLSIDDFGTGYSSLNYLKLLPLHQIKLDQSFVRGIESDANNAAICTATITMAHSLGLTVVAEGVESEAERDFLVSRQCDLLQGYLFSRPMGTAEATAFLEAHAARS